MFEYYDGQTIAGGYMGSNPFESFIANNYALNDIILPFVAFAAVMYIAFIPLKLEHKSKIAIITVISAMTVVFHVLNAYPWGWDPVVLLSRGLLMFGIIAFILILILMIVGVLGFDPAEAFNQSFGIIFLFLLCVFSFMFYPEVFAMVLVLSTLKLLQRIIIPKAGSINIVIIILLLMVFVFRFAFGWPQYTPDWLLWLNHPTIQTLWIAGFVMLIFIQFMTGDEDESFSKTYSKEE